MHGPELLPVTPRRRYGGERRTCSGNFRGDKFHPQKNYEIAAYDSLCAFADLLGESQHVSLPRQTLDEEKSTDQRLTELSEDENIAVSRWGAMCQSVPADSLVVS